MRRQRAPPLWVSMTVIVIAVSVLAGALCTRNTPAVLASLASVHTGCLSYLDVGGLSSGFQMSTDGNTAADLPATIDRKQARIACICPQLGPALSNTLPSICSTCVCNLMPCRLDMMALHAACACMRMVWSQGLLGACWMSRPLERICNVACA